jgi:hypothetical protein
MPKNDASSINKNKICQLLSNHYTKILYILCLIKYVYNLEKHGDNSLAGIIFSNIRILDNELEIKYCALDHRDYSRDDLKIDFSKLEGMIFFTNYFLTKDESKNFIAILKTILSKKAKSQLKEDICEYLVNNKVDEIKDLYFYKYKEKLVCELKGGELLLNIEKNNPIFSYNLCRAPESLRFKINTKEGKEAYNYYLTMKTNYDKNVKEIELLLKRIVSSEGILKELTKDELDNIIKQIKIKVQVFYIRTIIDYQNLFDIVKKIPLAFFIR